MAHIIDRNQFDTIRRRFSRLYPEQLQACLNRLEMMIGAYGVDGKSTSLKKSWDQKDIVLITYADSIRTLETNPLQTLHRFCLQRLKGCINTVHLLPFYPWSSDDGFSVIDYRQVDSNVGRWKEVENLGHDFDLMFDLVLNHVSSESEWFTQYVECVLPYNRYFKEASPTEDLKNVIRPRTSPLLTAVTTRDGEKHVWTTFSADQVDLDWQNPDVFFEFLDIFLGYIARGARIIRLDAVAFLWKKPGTTCLHLKETHEIVKLFRNILEMIAPGIILLTETNVPHKENISYFGQGDEAHMVYNFSLPPLLLHGLLSENSHHLRKWASEIGDLPEGCTFFNFTSSHDGIGVRPLQGILPPEDIEFLVGQVQERKGKVSFKSNADGTQSPYELNITYFEAMSVPGDLNNPIGISRFLTSQYIALALRGLPGVYVHSLTACPNDIEAAESSGIARRINRHKWDATELEQKLDDETSFHHQVFHSYLKVLRRRSQHPAFHPDAPQEILNLGSRCFGLIRTSRSRNQTVICLSNFTSEPLEISKIREIPGIGERTSLKDLISNQMVELQKDSLNFQPYQTMWLLM